MLKIKNISKKFKNFEALKDVNFEVQNSEIVGLLGENGAGKSTLLRILSTILTPTSGTAEIEGFDLLQSPAKIRENIGILFGSEVGLYEKLTGRENLDYFACLNGLDKKTANDRINFLAKQFSFEDYIDKQISKLSRGMKQKVSIARAILHSPKVIMLDEPDTGLDFKASKIIFDFMKNAKSEGKSIIFSSHSMENIKNYCDRVAVLHKGEIVKIFSMKEYRDKYTDHQINDILFNLVCDGEEN